MSVFISFTVAIGTEIRFIEVCAYVSKDEFDADLKLIYCSVSEHNFESLNF